MTATQLDALMDAILATMTSLRDRLTKRLDVLEQQMVVATAKQAAPKGVRWAGVYREQTPFSEGELVTHKGGLWLAIADTSARPGVSADWRLVVKSREAVDA